MGTFFETQCMLCYAAVLQLNPPRRSAAPAFAPNLGLLEPKKAVPDSLADSAVPRGNLSFSTVSGVYNIVQTFTSFFLVHHLPQSSR